MCSSDNNLVGIRTQEIVDDLFDNISCNKKYSSNQEYKIPELGSPGRGWIDPSSVGFVQDINDCYEDLAANYGPIFSLLL